MAKKLDEVLKMIGDRMPHREAIPAPPQHDVCPVCQGAGFLRMDVPVGDPNFGRLVPCDCRLAESDEQARRELEAASNMEAFAQKTLDSFDPAVHPAAQRAFEVARRYSEAPSGWLLLHGPCGSGKTHLSAAVANESIRRRRKSLFMIVPDLLDYLRETFNPRSEVTYDERFEAIRSVPMLVLDDLGTENATTWAREKLYQIVNHRYNTQLPTVLTTNQDLESIDERIRSRICDAALVTQVLLDAPDYRRRGQKTPSRRAQPQRVANNRRL